MAPPGFTLIATDDISSGTNEGTAVIEGIEAQGKWQIASKTNLLLNYAHVNVRETQDGLRRNFENLCQVIRLAFCSHSNLQAIGMPVLRIIKLVRLPNWVMAILSI